MPTITVQILAADPLLRVGATNVLRGTRGVALTMDGSVADVVVLVAAHVTRADVAAMSDTGAPRSVVVTDDLPRALLAEALAAGMVALLELRAVTGPDLLAVLRLVARGHGHFPPAVQGAFAAEFVQLRRNVADPHGLTLSGLTERESEVLRLIAEGFDTDEIARKLAYSERTVKGVLHRLMARHGLNHRAHAVAYALRTGAF